MGHLKYFGEQITDKNIDEFTGKEGNKVLLLSEKKKTTGLYKALSGHFNGRLSFGQVILVVVVGCGCGCGCCENVVV